MDGIETIRGIRAMAPQAPTPALIMATAYSREDLLAAADGLPLDGVLVKPASPSSMLDTIMAARGAATRRSAADRTLRARTEGAVRVLSGARLLLVEDNAVNQEVALEILGDAGAVVDVASNGAEALEKIGTTGYDAVLMDCQMPVMDGFEATRRIRANPRHDALPVIAMTANAMAGDRERCLEAGMNDHIAKPIDVAAMFATLTKWLDRGSATSPARNETPAAPQSTGQPAPAPASASASASASAQTQRAATAPAPARTKAPAEQPPVLDLDTALRRVGGRQGLLDRLMARFLQSEADAAERIVAAMMAGERDTATRAAHTLKGLSASLCANRLSASAAALESLLSAPAGQADAPGKPATDPAIGPATGSATGSVTGSATGSATDAAFHTAIAALDDALQEVIALLNARTSTQEGAGAQKNPTTETVAATPASSTASASTARAAPVDPRTFAPELRKLGQLVADADLEATQAFDALAARLAGAADADRVRRLGRLLADYDFDAALPLLEGLARELGVPLDR
jgi:CheY-like chemotaxis protein/HPt (histidine-containing phosphotransfer) domain-containing protein